MQGRLRNQYLKVRVETQCAWRNAPLSLEIDSHLNVNIQTPGARPLVFVPDVNLFALEEDSIIDAF